MPEHVDVIVVGAGVVGLAIARALAVSGHDIVVLESESSIGTGISSRNSEVIHAGIYYPKDSLKQRLSIRGRKLLYRYCMDRAVDIKQLGKLIVATTESEISQLEMLRRRAVHNGVNELVWLDQNKALALEPELRCVAALLSPSTGIVDSHALMLALQGDAEAAGATFAFRSPFIAGRSDGEKLIVDVGGSDAIELSCNWLVNAAGLDAVNVAARFVGLSKKHVPRSWLCKGHYFALRGPSPFSHLIYPVPEQAGLGVHLTLDLAGQARFGPDTEWITEINYDVDQQRAARFYTSIQRYWPALAAGSLLSGYAGIRPKISGPLDPAADFRIDGPKFHGVGGLINLFGIESPGLTAALAIADEVNHVIQSGEPSGVAKM